MVIVKLLKLQTRYIPLLATASVFAILYSIGLASFSHFGSLRVFVNLLGDNAFLGIAAIGATFVILSGGIDLSVGSVIACTSILMATLLEKGWVPATVISMALLFGICFGAAMGCLIHCFALPAFLVTLAGMFFARGLGFIIHPQALGINHPFFLNTIGDNLAIRLPHGVEFPFTASCFVVALLVAMAIAHMTVFGRNVYAVGGNEQAAKLMGVRIGSAKLMIYTLAGFFSALAGVVFTFYMQSGNPASCVGLELDAIAAVVIGGTLLSGGVGYLAGTFLGILVLGLIQTLITFHGDLNTWWTKIVIGMLVLVFILLQNLVTTMTKKGIAQ